MNLEKTVLAVEGMSCASCVRHVEQALRALDGVSDVAVVLAEKRADVAYDSARVTTEALIQAVEAAGYEAQARAAG